MPSTLGPYELLTRLGAGGMAEVWKARAFGASGFEKIVVLKVLLPELVGEARYERMFIEEAKLHARLVHQNLVQVHELGSAGGQYFVRLDFVDGADLARLGAPMPEPFALYVAEQLALGLDYVHRVTDDVGRPLGLVHRDVSPSNVLLSREGEVKLVDLGIAKATALRDTTRAGVRKGKYAYMSPEQVSGLGLTAASDQFGLAVTLIELLTGGRPFDGATPLETMDRVREASPPALDGVADDVKGVLLRALAKEPAARFASSEALRRALAVCRRARGDVGAIELAGWVNSKLVGGVPRQ
ncbi:MAG: serine/threonine protein kinase [Myxococcaceae bacterium]|nr:serine/threonine protein kinase [Myxococcaceae bacterium]